MNARVSTGPFLTPIPAEPTPDPGRPRRFFQFSGSPSNVPSTSAPIFDGTRFVWLNGTKPFAYSAVSQKIVDAPSAANVVRAYLSLRNTSAAQTVYIDYGQNATTDSGIALLPGETIAYDSVIPQDDVYVIGSGAGTVAVLWSDVPLPV